MATLACARKPGEDEDFATNVEIHPSMPGISAIHISTIHFSP